MQEFIKQMETEKANNSSKGKWEDWKPHPADWLWEMQYHVAKLQKAIQNGDTELIKEHSADLGLYAEKAFYVYGVDVEKLAKEQELLKKLSPEHKVIYEKFLSNHTYQLAYSSMAGVVSVSDKEFLSQYDPAFDYVVFDSNGQKID